MDRKCDRTASRSGSLFSDRFSTLIATAPVVVVIWCSSCCKSGLHGIKEVANLPRGVLIGTVELFDCDGGNWHVRKPDRAEKLIPPTKQPQPAWFHPF